MTAPGTHMAAEIAEAPQVFARAAAADHAATLAPLDLSALRAIYTLARGSSDAAANILSYEIMRETGLPVTSLPPSVFSVGQGVRTGGALGLIVSQSGGSDDLVRSARGIRAGGGTALAVTNVAGSPVERASDATLPIGAGEELAVPATKTVIGAIATGMALLRALAPAYDAPGAGARFAGLSPDHPRSETIRAALLRASHVFVVGRDTGYGAAQEIALKLKECCALHAEAYSASEVLHGPLQLATNPLLVLMLDTGHAPVAGSLDIAEDRLRAAGGEVIRLRPADIGAQGLTPAASAAALLLMTYPVVRDTAIALGHDPDAPATLSKVTVTT